LAKIVIISHYAPSLLNFRGDLIEALIHQKHEVFCLAPEEGYESHLREIGASYQHIPLKRTGLNPLKDVYTLFKLRRILKELKPDIVLSYTVKPIVYGSIAAHRAGVKRYMPWLRDWVMYLLDRVSNKSF
jgi:UDP-N-acetylglucosamine:LPS N-acetylglucosamine transferase